MNSENCKKALEKVGNPNVLINIVSRRVRQLTGASGSQGHPMISNTAGLGAADICLLEIIEGKLDWEAPLTEAVVDPATRNKRRKA